MAGTLFKNVLHFEFSICNLSTKSLIYTERGREKKKERKRERAMVR